MPMIGTRDETEGVAITFIEEGNFKDSEAFLEDAKRALYVLANRL